MRAHLAAVVLSPGELLGRRQDLASDQAGRQVEKVNETCFSLSNVTKTHDSYNSI